jgi:ATP-dependent DNA helicase RecQ
MKPYVSADNAVVHTTLRTVFGFASFRPNQETIVNTILNKRTFAVMPTGGERPCVTSSGTLLEGSVLSALLSRL